jgi:nucleoside-diphosphate-sugar epimerase
MRRRHVLVTGANGFVGRHIVARAPARGAVAVAAHGDLRVLEVCREVVASARPAAVVHAASARLGDSGGAWDAIADNMRMIGNMVTALEELAPDSPLLVPGSAAQYGRGALTALSEEAPQQPVSAYGAMKSTLEAAATAFPLRGRVRVIWTRSFNHLGPGQPPSAPVSGWARQAAEAERRGEGVLRTGRLDVVRDFLDVRDVADAYLDLVESPAEGPVNVCSGRGRRLHEILDALLDMTRAEVRVEPDPSLLREHDPPVVVGDPGRLRTLTGWRPRWSFEASLAAVLEGWRSQLGASAPPVASSVHG